MGKKKDTIFDDVFRAILERMPQIIIPLVNEAFHTSYGVTDLKIQMKNEHVDAIRNKKLVTDSLLWIGDKHYHLECQREMNNSMIIRMFEYDVSIALEEARKNQKTDSFELHFPGACVLCLSDSKNVGKSIDMPIHFGDGSVHNYKVPVIKAQEYSKEEIFQKELLMLLPYYILRYKKQYGIINEDVKKQDELKKEYESICSSLYKKIGDTEYNDLIGMIKDILKRETQEYSNVWERMDEVMSKHTYELHSERMMRLGREEEQIRAVNVLLRKRGMTEEEACEFLEVDLENYRAYKETMKKKELLRQCH